MLSDKISKKFKISAFSTVKDFQTSTKCPLSLETLTAVVNRGKEPSIPAFIIMAYLLGFTPLEIADACKEAGDTIYWRLISPVFVSEEDKAMLDIIKALPADKKKAVKDLLKTLGA